jgi:AcrR family transcriptional regulator
MAYLSAEERRQTIVDAAVDVIATEGLTRATTRRIAEKADAPLGALHYCFRDKEELITLVAQQGAAMLNAAFAEVDPSRGVEATIRDSVDACWHWVRDNGGLQLALMELGLWKIREGGDNVYAMWDAFGGDLLRENLRRALESDPVELRISIPEIVRFINHRLDGLAYEYAASRDVAACARQMQLLADALVYLALGVDSQRAGRGRRAAGRPVRSSTATPATTGGRAPTNRAKRKAS